MPKQPTIDLVIGAQIDPGAVQQLISEVSKEPLTDATLYVGYPILSTADESLALDALLTSREHGIVVFWERDGRGPRFQDGEGPQWGRGMRCERRESGLGAGLDAAELA